MHKCGKSNSYNSAKDTWFTCTVCDGRVHQKGCTSKRNPLKDCCKERHLMLYNQGHKKGIVDSSFDMLDENNWCKY